MFSFKHLAALLTAAGVSATAGLAAGQSIDLPDIGDSSGAYISPVEERRVGETLLRQARQSGALLDDPEIEEYLNDVGNRLVALADHSTASEFTFFVVNDPRINAFAVPGGVIGVNAGLLINSQSEDELASVLAHEIAHVTQRHGARGYEAASKLSLPLAAAMLGAILMGIANPEAGQAAVAAVSAGSQQYQINFTRANEQEADRVGVQLLARAGFDPRAMPAFFERLQAANRYNDPKTIPEFLRTHPVTPNRIAETRALAAQYPVKKTDDSQRYQLARARARVLSEKDPLAAVRTFEAELRAGQFQDERVARYGYGLALMVAGEYGKARVHIERLAQEAPEQLAFTLALAELEREERDFTAALEKYSAALARHPEYRPAIVGYAETLLAAGEPGRAREVLRDYTYHHAPDPLYYRLVAQAEGQSGSKVESHIALAEYYYRSGYSPMAVEQLKLAQDYPQADSYQRQRIEARMGEIEKEMEEAKKSGFGMR